MSFTTDVKHEICQDRLDDGQARAQLAGLLLVKASLHMNSTGMYLSFEIENATVAKHVWMLLKRLYQVQPSLAVIRKMKLKKNNVYRIEVGASAADILADLQILDERGLHLRPGYDLIRSEKNARAFIQGCFLASGSVNSPKTSNYHLEMSAAHEELARSIVRTLERFSIPARITQRKNMNVVYIKAGDKVADLLRLVNASNMLMAFEDQRISRDFYNQMRRLDNCELANEMKSMKAAENQLEAIDIIEKKFAKARIPQTVQETMALRRKFPEASITELCDEIYKETGKIISKSGMKHRLRKLVQLAEEAGNEN